MPYCPYCGSEVADDDVFCRSCGTTLNGNGPVPQGPKDNSRRMRIIALLLVGTILVSAAAGIIAAIAFDFDLRTEYNNTYRWEYEGKSFSYELYVDGDYYKKMSSSTIDRTGSISAERYTTETGVQVAVKDYIVVDSYIQALADALKVKYNEAFGADPNEDQYVKFAASFVQKCIRYDWDEYRSEKDYWRYPLETLCEKVGDCEDTSILLSALIQAGGYEAGIILLPGHAMCAVTAATLVDGPYQNIRNSPVYSKDFYPIETTADTTDEGVIGVITDQYKVVYMHLYLGHVTDYFSS